MQRYEPRGIQSSPRADASPPNNTTARPTEQQCAELDLALSELIERMETTTWSDAPGITAAEAAAWTARLVEARDAVRGATSQEEGA